MTTFINSIYYNEKRLGDILYLTFKGLDFIETKLKVELDFLKKEAVK
jgi:hypothetical protein